MKVLGRDLILSINNKNLACAKSCDLSLDTDFIEVCAPDGGEWEDYIPSTNSWGCSASALCTTMEYFDQLEQIWHDRTMITLRMYDTKMGCFYKGNAYIKKLNVVGNDKGLVTMSVTFQPKGELLKATKETMDIDNATQIPGFTMYWPETGKKYVYLRSVESGGGVRVLPYYTAAYDVRINAYHKIVVLKAQVSEVEGWLEDLNTKAFNDAAILYAGAGEETSAVKKGGSILGSNLTVVVNEGDATLTYPPDKLKRNFMKAI